MLTIYPFADAADVVFLFPDGQPGLGLINDVAAGIKSFTPVR
jgi:hypothetical protein